MESAKIMNSNMYDLYLDILKGELIPAFGCTEPIAIALAGAKAREVMGEDVLRIDIAVSNNILKNVKSVVVPNTNGKRGIESAVAIGVVAGKAEKNLEVLGDVTETQIEALENFMKKVPITIKTAENTNIFDIVVYLYGKEHRAKIRITDYHTNIVYLSKDDTILIDKQQSGEESEEIEIAITAVKDILECVNNIDIEKLIPYVGRQIEFNTKIAEHGMKYNYGANVGKNIARMYGDDIKVRARAKAAAGSDARMSGCEMPVVVVSGSGNQGITSCVPVVEYAKFIECDQETMIRAVALSDLLTIYVKQGVGRLSAYCGVVCAGCSAGAAIAYLDGGDYMVIVNTLINSLAIVSGIICDGAKPSCAGKIASAVDAGIMGWQMAKNGDKFLGGDGIVAEDVDNTILNVGVLASQGMRQTDDVIVDIMLNQ